MQVILSLREAQHSFVTSVVKLLQKGRCWEAEDNTSRKEREKLHRNEIFKTFCANFSRDIVRFRHIGALAHLWVIACISTIHLILMMLDKWTITINSSLISTDVINHSASFLYKTSNLILIFLLHFLSFSRRFKRERGRSRRGGKVTNNL